MDTKAFLFNSWAKYQAGGHFKWKPDLSLTDQQIAVDNKGSRFKALFQNVFADYQSKKISNDQELIQSDPTSYPQNPPLTGDITVANHAWNIWKSTGDWWQCLLNFTLWCATARCGVSFQDHFQAKDPPLASVYWFHVYYMTGVF